MLGEKALSGPDEALGVPSPPDFDVLGDRGSPARGVMFCSWQISGGGIRLERCERRGEDSSAPRGPMLLSWASVVGFAAGVTEPAGAGSSAGLTGEVGALDSRMDS